MGNPRSPLGFVDRLVAGKQFLLPLRTEPVEAGGKVVVDEHVLRAGDAQADGLDAAAVVVVLEEPDAERLVQRPDPLVGGSRHGHAEEADCRDVEEDPGMLARMPRRNLLHLRSEEHTSELQSLMRISYAVFCLTKKNKQQR